MRHEIINAHERVGKQTKWTSFFVLNKVRVWRPWQHTFTLLWVPLPPAYSPRSRDFIVPIDHIQVFVTHETKTRCQEPVWKCIGVSNRLVRFFRSKAKFKNGMRVFRRVQATRYLLGIKIDQIVINRRLCRHIDHQKPLKKSNNQYLKLETHSNYTTITLTLQVSRIVFLTSVKQAAWKKFRVHSIAHYTVTCTGRNEAGVDLVLIQPFLLYHVNNVFLMLTSVF